MADPVQTQTNTMPVVEELSTVQVLRRGVRTTPVLMSGLAATLVAGLVFAAGQVAAPVVIQLALDRGGIATGQVDIASIWVFAICGVAVIVASELLGVALKRRIIKRAEEALRQLRTMAFDHVHRLSLQTHGRQSTGLLVSRVTSDVDVLARFVDWAMFVWMVQPAVVVGLFITIAVYSWPLALVALAVFLPIVGLLRWMRERMTAAHLERQRSVGDMLGGYTEALAGGEVLRAYRAQAPMRLRLSELSDRRYRASLRANIYMATVFVVGDMLVALTTASMLVVGLAWRDALALTAGELVAILFLGSMLQSPINELGETLNEAQVAVAGWRNVLGVLDEPVEALDPAAGSALPLGALGVQLRGVNFFYHDAEIASLSDVTVKIPAGQRIAVVGATGSGKSTFGRLLCRLADPTTGTVSVGGVDLTEVSVTARQAGIRFVPQDSFLFAGTVRDNIAMGREGVTEAEIDGALTTLGLGEWAASLNDGLDTTVGERGSLLSVGERQLVSFVRAAVANPGLLVLDEATSSVDQQTDLMLTAAIDRLAQGRTVVSIAHRMATAESADLVLVFDAGRLIESGPHDELVKQSGNYAELYRAWGEEMAPSVAPTTPTNPVSPRTNRE